MHAQRRGRRTAGTLAFLGALLGGGQVVGCSGSPPQDGADSGSGGGGASSGGSGSGESGGADATGGLPGSGGSVPEGAPTWAEDIASIVYRECVGCHREGGVGPFPLETYEQATEVALAAVVHVEQRHMPPMPVDGSGSCNTYSNARRLTDEEIDLFGEWVEYGMPLGDVALAPPLPEPPATLEAPDVILDPGVQYTPNDALSDDYRCFIIDPGLTEDQYIVEYEVVPGDPRIVHHAIVYEPSSESAAEEALALDAAEAGPGYTCFGGAGIDSEPRVLWAPGGGYAQFPEGTGVPLTAGRPQILQVHYNLEHGAFPDQTTVKLSLADEVPHPAYFQPIADLDLVLEPGLERATTTRTFSAFGQPFVVHGVMPHMHTLGRELSVSVDADGSDHCLVTVDHWDFHSQGAWWYTEPLTFDAVDNVTISCTFDTTERTEQVTWGESTMDEMCLTYLYVTVPE